MKKTFKWTFQFCLFQNLKILLHSNCNKSSILWQDILAMSWNPQSNINLSSLMRLPVIIVNLQGNYNKKIAPFVFDEDTWSNFPANVSVSMAVTDILKIEEVDHVYTMKFRLVLEW